MATRFYGRESEVGSPPVAPAYDGGWWDTAAPANASPMYTTSDGADTLADVGSFNEDSGQPRLVRQWVSEPMAAGNAFTIGGETYKCQIQMNESNADDELQGMIGVRIVSEDGATVRAVVQAVSAYNGAEFNTTRRNYTFLSGGTGQANYTTVAGDRLVVEFGILAVAGTTPVATVRLGSAGTADLPEDQTDAATTKRPWFEVSLTLSFAGAPGANNPMPFVASGAGYYPAEG